MDNNALKKKKNLLSFATEEPCMRTWMFSHGKVRNNENKQRTKPDYCIATTRMEQHHDKLEQGLYCMLVEHSPRAWACVQ